MLQAASYHLWKQLLLAVEQFDAQGAVVAGERQRLVMYRQEAVTLLELAADSELSEFKVVGDEERVDTVLADFLCGREGYFEA